MTVEQVAAVLLIGVPVVFSVAFLGRPSSAWSIGMALLVGTFEFVGPNEPKGSQIAGAIVTIAYIAWSLWLMALGLVLIV